MTESFKRIFGLNKVIAAVCLVILVVSFSEVWLVQSGYRKKPFTVTASEDLSTVSVYYFDIGQGDSIFIDTPNRDVLIDGGSAEATPILDYLSSLNITHIHLMIATHVHEDHIGGLIAVLNSTINVDEILINNQTYTSNAYTDFMELTQNHKVTVSHRGQIYSLTETVNLTVFNPVQPLEFTKANDNSVVVKLQVSTTSFLFTGDAEADAEQSMLNAGLNLQSNILKVGHHGSRTATTQPFLDSVAPSYAIISAGENNIYGHPHQETIQKLLAKGVTIYGTFQSGTIMVSTDGTSITFQDSPQPIPEFSPEIILPLFMIATLLVVIFYRRKANNVLFDYA
jgi:beta-lactamase superfamily II metal-dependent hydrolase